MKLMTISEVTKLLMFQPEHFDTMMKLIITVPVWKVMHTVYDEPSVRRAADNYFTKTPHSIEKNYFNFK